MGKILEKLGIKKARNKSVETTNPNLVANEVQRRIIVFGFLIVLSLSLIIIQLFRIQVISNEAYTEKLANYTRRYETITTPRGEFLDRNGEVIVSNRISKAIVYYPPLGVSLDDTWEMAQKFSKRFTIDESSLNKSDKQDLFMFLYPDIVKGRLSDQENQMYIDKEITNNELHQIKKSKVTDSDIENLSVENKKAYLVYQRMTMATSGGMKLILNDVTNEEIAYLAEHNLDFPGFESYSNWERDYSEDYGLRSIIGSVSSESQGIPAESLQYYLAKDYSRNERMGRSGLELYYEDIVSGDKKIQDVVYSEDGFANPIEVREGKKGDNIIMTIDLKLQEKIEQIAIDNLEREKNNPNRKYFDNVYMMVSNPKNGDILASVVVKRDDEGNYYNIPSLNHLDAVIPGSTIKGAMVYLGLSEGVVSPNEQISDAPIKIASTPQKRSYQNLISTNAISALAQSSNVYMFHVAMRVAEAIYEYDQPLYGVNKDDFDILKENYSRFGLGTKTGIDMPLEELGYIGNNYQGGLLLDYAMGQYDSYTPMQLNAYINTIANDGIRVKPRYVKSAQDPLTGLTVFDNEVEVLSVLSDKEALDYVKRGFRACVTDGLCRQLNTDIIPVAAKTGTAENTFRNKEGQIVMDAPHSLLVGYAPFENPEVTITCVTQNSTNGPLLSNICAPMTNEVLDYYFNNK